MKSLKSYIYLIIPIIASLFIIARIFNSWEVFSFDSDSARYFLSAVAQSLAALFALVITVSLIIMQHLTQLYTYKIFEVYIKRFKTGSFFSISAITLIYSLWLLLRINGKQPCNLQSVGIDIILVLSILSIVWLIIYFFDLLNIVKPEKFLNMIESKINKNSDKRKELISVIGEICSISMKKGDLPTAKECTAIFERIMDSLLPEQRTILFEKLDNLYEKAIETDSAEMISIINGLSIYHPAFTIVEHLRGNS